MEPTRVTEVSASRSAAEGANTTQHTGVSASRSAAEGANTTQHTGVSAAERVATVAVAVLDGGVVTVEHVELPDRSAGEIDIAITTAAICGSDLHTFLGHRPAPERTALGHEGVGTIVDADDDACDLDNVPLRAGDRVVFSMLSSCGVCDRCVNGLTMKCRSIVKYGHTSVMTPPFATGTLASRVRLLPTVPVLRVPDGLSDAEVVSAGCAVATAAAVVDAAGALPAGGRVLVLGAGAVGAYCVAMFASLGAGVHVREPVDERRMLAEQLGAAPDGDPRARFPIVVEASGHPVAVADAIGGADVGGRVLLTGSVSPGSSTATFDPAVVVTNRLAVFGVHNYTADDFRWGVEWLASYGRALGLERLTSPPFELANVSAAFDEMRAGTYPRVLVRPGTDTHHRAGE